MLQVRLIPTTKRAKKRIAFLVPLDTTAMELGCLLNQVRRLMDLLCSFFMYTNDCTGNNWFKLSSLLVKVVQKSILSQF